MEYNRVVAVTGLPGLYEVVSTRTDGALVRSLEENTTKFISSRVHNLSHLESIEVYTVRDNVSLTDIFQSMKNSGLDLPDTKDNKTLRGYFEKAFPDMDFDRVYSSDMKKMVKWYEILTKADIDFSKKEEEPVEEETAVTETPLAETPSAEATEAKPKKTSRKKKADSEEA